ncbi:MAG: TonB family protein, partial [Pseudomonadota bacterium]
MAFTVIAIAIHLVIAWTTDTGAPLAAGGETTAGSPLGAAGDLNELIESWEDQPETAGADEIEQTDIVEDSVDQPDELPDTETFEVSNLTRPDQLLSPIEAVQRPQLVRPPQITPQAVAPSVPVLSPPVQAAPSPDLPQLDLPTTSVVVPETLPLQNPVSPRADEPVPDPNQPPQDLNLLKPIHQADAPDVQRNPTTALAMSVQPSVPQRIALPQPNIAAPTIPKTEPEPTVDDEGAPLIAAMPRTKPTPPKLEQPKRPKKQAANTKPSLKKTQPTQRVAKRAPNEPKKEPPKGSTTGAPLGSAQTGNEGQGQKTAALTAGVGGVAADGGYLKAAVNSARKGYLTAVRRAVERKKRFPKRAKRRGTEGTAKVRVTLDASGKLVAAMMVSSSGESILDEAAMAAVKRVSSFPDIPKEMGKSQVNVTLPIT